jgi:hypothetical protein
MSVVETVVDPVPVSDTSNTAAHILDPVYDAEADAEIVTTDINAVVDGIR